MKDVSFVSSAGLRTILKLYRKTHQNGGDLTLKNVSPSVAKVIEMTGFSNLLG